LINFEQEGYFNFSIQQPEANMVKVASDQSIKLSESSKPVDRRYLTLKYILSRKVNSRNSLLYFDDAR
jgi:hypothetical protein